MSRSSEIPVPREESLHLRPMQMLVEAALRFKAAITVMRGNREADAKSLLDVMMLAAEKGALRFEADGPDEAEALRAIEGVMKEALSGK